MKSFINGRVLIAAHQPDQLWVAKNEDNVQVFDTNTSCSNMLINIFLIVLGSECFKH
ncbi:MAG: hypothetical protein JWQ40_1630 [Segetibacter sp.]|jgi:hypothetical protein|nr:hypothetical protein [Segetibacter sp.]